MEEQNVRLTNGGTKTLTVLYAIVAVICGVGGLLLNSFGLFADGVLSVMLLSGLASENKRTVLSRTLCIAGMVLGAYAALVGFFSVSALIGYADSSASIYAYPLFALIIIAKVAGLLSCEEDSAFRTDAVFSLAVTVIVVVATVLLTVAHYFEPAVACALGVYIVYRGVKTLLTTKKDTSEEDIPSEENSAE